VLVIPLAVANRLLGYMSVMFPSTLSKKDVSAEQRLLAQSLASLAAISIETNRLAKRAQDAALAEERNRLAQELHDTLAGAFTAISMQLQAASDLADSNEELRNACINRAEDLAGYGLRNVREFVQSLTLGSTKGSSLALEMRTLLLSATSGTGTNGIFTVEGEERPPDSACSHALLRVMQEALGNAQRYAEAKNILVALHFGEDLLSVTISDDGKGFIVDQSTDKGFGLTGIRSRISLLSGTCLITSTPGAGTKVFVELPYANTKRAPKP
jgi:signal transduction histidine kinase